MGDGGGDCEIVIVLFIYVGNCVLGFIRFFVRRFIRGEFVSSFFYFGVVVYIV